MGDSRTLCCLANEAKQLFSHLRRPFVPKPVTSHCGVYTFCVNQTPHVEVLPHLVVECSATSEVGETTFDHRGQCTHANIRQIAADLPRPRLGVLVEVQDAQVPDGKRVYEIYEDLSQGLIRCIGLGRVNDRVEESAPLFFLTCTQCSSGSLHQGVEK